MLQNPDAWILNMSLRGVLNLQGMALHFTCVHREYTILGKMFYLSSFHLTFMKEKLVCCLITSHSQTVETLVGI